jgi:hypothetical protein
VPCWPSPGKGLQLLLSLSVFQLIEAAHKFILKSNNDKKNGL